MRPRLVALGVAATSLLSLGTACGHQVNVRSELLGWVAATAAQGRAFEYVERYEARTTTVSGVIGDDYRYRASVTVDGRAAYGEVVSDDARALQVSDHAWLARLLAPGVGAGTGSPPAAVAQLGSGGWVVDPRGASTFQTSAAAPLGQDPVLDAVTALDYLNRAVEQAGTVQKFNPEASDYLPENDPFPHSLPGATRYDVLPAPLPNRLGPGLRGGATSAPGWQHMRKIAVYVRGGRIVAFREASAIKDILENPDDDLAGHLRDLGITIPAGPEPQQEVAIVAALNALGKRLGLPAIRLRTLEVTLRAAGADAVTLPAGATTGDLSAFTNPGQVLTQTLH